MVGVQIFASLTVRGRKSKGQGACGLTDGTSPGWALSSARLGHFLALWLWMSGHLPEGYCPLGMMGQKGPGSLRVAPALAPAPSSPQEHYPG